MKRRAKCYAIKNVASRDAWSIRTKGVEEKILLLKSRKPIDHRCNYAGKNELVNSTQLAIAELYEHAR